MILASLLLIAGGFTVELSETAKCSGASLRLGDVAVVRGDDAAAVERLKNLDLGYSPSPGYSRLLHTASLKNIILREMPEAKVTFSGKPSVRVYPKLRTVQPKEIEEAARKMVAQKFQGLDVELSLGRPLTELSVPAGRKTFSIMARPAVGPQGQGSHGVAVDILVDGELWRTQWTTWNVHRWQQVAVLTRAVGRGEKLSSNLFRMERRRQEISTKGVPVQPAHVIEAKATRDLAAGSPVFDKDIERAQVISRGHTVKVEIISGRVRVSSEGIAQENGRLGDTIRVMMAGSKKLITGQVVGVNQVELRLR